MAPIKSKAFEDLQTTVIKEMYGGCSIQWTVPLQVEDNPYYVSSDIQDYLPANGIVTGAFDTEQFKKKEG